MNRKNTCKKIATITLMVLIGNFLLCSCSKDDVIVEEKNLIKEYGLVGKYEFQVSPVGMMGALTTGTIEGTINEEESGVLRLRFSGFRAKPMPYEMSVDVQFTVTEISQGLMVHAVEGKGYFDAVPPAGDSDSDEGLHSNGKAKIVGQYKPNEKGEMQMDLELDPEVDLPVVIDIETVKKLH